MSLISLSAPEFTVEALMSNKTFAPLTLNSFAQSGQWVVLMWFELAFSSSSNEELVAFGCKQASDRFADLNAQVVALSCDNSFAQLKWSEQNAEALHVPLVSDFNKSVSKAYGVLAPDGSGLPLSATIVIDGKGIVRHVAFCDKSFTRSVDEVLRLVLAFQHCDARLASFSSSGVPASSSSSSSSSSSASYSQLLTPLATAPSSSSSSSSTGTSTNPLFALLQQGAARYQRALQEAPLQTKALTSCAISLVGELIGSYIKWRRRLDAHMSTRANSRAAAGGPPSAEALAAAGAMVDPKRLAIFGVYGLAITAPLFHWWYGFLERLVRMHRADPLSPRLQVLLKIVIDRLVLTPPFMAFTLGFLTYLQTFSGEKTLELVKRNYAIALYTNWKVWTPCQAVNFALVPLEYRVLFGNMVALWWNIYLSLAT